MLGVPVISCIYFIISVVGGDVLYQSLYSNIQFCIYFIILHVQHSIIVCELLSWFIFFLLQCYEKSLFQIASFNVQLLPKELFPLDSKVKLCTSVLHSQHICK